MIREKQQKMNILLLNLLAFFSILSPSVNLPGMPHIRIEHAVGILVILYLLSKGLLEEKLDVKTYIFPILMILFALISITSMINGNISGYNIVVNDIFELYKIFVYVVIFIAVSSLIVHEGEKTKIVKSLNFYIFISNLIAFSQYVNLFNLNTKYIKYIAPSQQRALMPGYTWPRVVGLSNNPNVYAYIVVIGLVLSLALFLSTKKKFYVFSMGTNFIALLMTRSRTGFVMFGITVSVFILIYIVENVFKGQISLKDKGKWLVGFGALLVISLIVFLFVLPESITWRVKEIFNLASVGSWQARIKNWGEYVDYFVKHPIVGIGPVKSIDYIRHPDNEWIMLLKRYGLVGTFYFAFMFIIPIAINWKRLKSSLVGKVFIAVTVGCFVYMIPAIAFHSFQLMSVTMILAALALTDTNKSNLESI